METKSGITKAAWGKTDGQDVDLYTLTNSKGVQVKISTYGATVTSWEPAGGARAGTEDGEVETAPHGRSPPTPGEDARAERGADPRFGAPA